MDRLLVLRALDDVEQHAAELVDRLIRSSAVTRLPRAVGNALAFRRVTGTSVRDLANEGMTMMCVTHEMRFARRVADRIILIADKGIAEEGSPEQLLDDPQTDRARDFLASLDEE